MIMHIKRLNIILISAAILLTIPLVAMQFTNEVNWAVSDFIIGGILFFGIGLAFEFVLRMTKSMKKRMVIIISLTIAFLLLWAELAVGIFGTPIAGS